MSTPAAPGGAADLSSSVETHQVASSCLDLLLIELVPMAYRIATELAEREEQWASGGPVKAPGSGTSTTAGSVARTTGGTAGRGGETAVGSVTGPGTAVDEDEMREAVFYRLEMLGYRVGLGVVEK
jgi:trafficking protein particle complex subunit 6